MDEAAITSLLERLGLTEYESKTLVALFKLKETEAPEISRSAQVPKTRVYDVLDRLTKKKLVIEIYGRPKKYRVIDADAVFAQLLKEKKEELKTLEEQADEIKKYLDTNGEKDEAAEKVMKVKDKLDFMRILGQEIDRAKSDVVAFTTIDKEHSLLKNSLKNAMNKKVKVKILSAVPKEVAVIAKEFADAGVDLKDFEHGMHAYIIDGKKVIMALSDFKKEKPEYHFTIWPNNKIMAGILQGHFDKCWQSAERPKH